MLPPKRGDEKIMERIRMRMTHDSLDRESEMDKPSRRLFEIFTIKEESPPIPSAKT
jgi:hypothetical protein